MTIVTGKSVQADGAKPKMLGGKCRHVPVAMHSIGTHITIKDFSLSRLTRIVICITCRSIPCQPLTV